MMKLTYIVVITVLTAVNAQQIISRQQSIRETFPTTFRKTSFVVPFTTTFQRPQSFPENNAYNFDTKKEVTFQRLNELTQSSQTTLQPNLPTITDFSKTFQAALPQSNFVANRVQPAFTPPISFGIVRNKLEDLLEQEWTLFKIAFNKTYQNFEQERQRKEIFIENRNKVLRFNQDYGLGRYTFVQKLNQYADLLNHEFSSIVNGFNRTKRAESRETPQEKKFSAYIPSANVAMPPHVDWREAGAVSPVRRQGSCGACYAFAAAGALEGQTYRRTGRLLVLSPQNLIDCTENYGNNGCSGGVMDSAFEYVRDNKGIDTENAYPFEEKDGQQCRYRRDGYGTHNTGYTLIDEGDEKALEVAIATVGPVAIGIDAHPDSFQFYSNGIYYEPQCSSSAEQLNHAVLIVGYGTEPNGQQYWLIKNSYGPEWGIGGYMKIAKFSNNHCGVASYAAYPLL